jgi:MoaA/NifB/PqqE/SkfB family radical SAM enzyme
MKAWTLYFDDSSGHDAWTSSGDFSKLLGAFGDAAFPKQLNVAVTQSTFSRLDRIVAFACAMAGRSAPVLGPFDVLAHAENLADGFFRYITNVEQALSGLPVSLGATDPNLTQILENFDQRQNPKTRSNLLRLLGVMADDVFIGPHTFHLDISNRCNTNCVFCGLHSPMLLEPQNKIFGRRFTQGWKGRIVDEEIFTNLVDDLASIGCKEDILFSGEGEPLTHPAADRMIRYVKSKQMDLTLFTNGHALNDKLADLLVDSNLDILYWSLSAGSAKTFVKLQPAKKAADFSRAIDVMRYMVSQKKKKQAKPFIILAHVINAFNYDECEKVMELAVSIGVDSVRYQVMHSCSSTESLLINKDQFTVAKQQIDRARILAEQAGIEIVANIDFQLLAAEKTYALPEAVLPCHWSHDLYSRTGCLAGWFFSRAFTDGRISFCCHDKIVGNLYRARFADWWFSSRYRNVRKAAKAFDESNNIDMTDECCGGMLLEKDCNYCGNYEFINQGLADLSDLGWDRFLRRDP